MKRFLLCSLFATLAFGTAALAADSPTIKIISSLPRTGSANAQAQTIVNGIKMAIDEAGGKVGKFTIEYEDWDDASPERGQWDPAVEAGNAQKAVQDPNIMAYIGTYNSGAAKISMPILNKASLVQVSPANTYPGLTKPGLGEANEPQVYRPSGKINYFRVVPADDIQGEVAAMWAKELGVKKVFILHDRELYGKGVADVFKRACGKLGIQIVGYEGIDPKAANYRSLVTKIKGTDADLVYFGGTTQTNAGQLAKDLVAVGARAKLMLPDGCREQALIESAGRDNLNDRTYVTFGGLPPKQLKGRGKDFYENYTKKFNAEPEAYAVYGYEAARVVLEGIKRAGKKDRAAITEAITGLRDFDGVLGKWSFDQNGDTSLKVMMVEIIKDGKFTPVKIVGLNITKTEGTLFINAGASNEATPITVAAHTEQQDAHTPKYITWSDLPSEITVGGVTYENVRWKEGTPTAARIFHKTGVATIPFTELPKDIQKAYGYDVEKIAREMEASEGERVAASERREEGRWQLLKRVRNGEALEGYEWFEVLSDDIRYASVMSRLGKPDQAVTDDRKYTWKDRGIHSVTKKREDLSIVFGLVNWQGREEVCAVAFKIYNDDTILLVDPQTAEPLKRRSRQ